jgi:membrane protease YdiL (CAAX protease family)
MRGMEKRSDLMDSDVLMGPEDDPPGHDVIVLFAVFFEGGLAPLALLMGWWFGHNPLQNFAWRAADAVIGAAAAIPPVLCFLAMLRWPLGPFAKLKAFCEEEFVPLLANSTWRDIALIALSAGVGEEMLFRGVFQSAIGAATGVASGLVISSLLFGMLHPISVPYALVTFAMGMYLGGLYLVTNNLLTAIVTHGLYDFMLMAYLLRIKNSGRPAGNPIAEIDSDRKIDEYDDES